MHMDELVGCSQQSDLNREPARRPKFIASFGHSTTSFPTLPQSLYTTSLIFRSVQSHPDQLHPWRQ